MRKQKRTSESSVIAGKKGYTLLPEELPVRTLFLITLLSLMLYPQKVISQNICVYPFENTSDNPTLNWIGPYISYHIFRNIKAATGESIWSPVFLYEKDKLASSNPDSLKKHQERWNWPFLVKGKYRTLQDSIVFKTEIYRFSKKELKEKTYITSCHADSYIKGIDKLFRHILSIISEDSNNSEIPLQPEIKNTEAASVFGSGLYFEFNNKADKAISSYTFALAMDPDFSWAHLKIGELYSKSNKFEKAHYHLSKAAKLNRRDPIPVSAYAVFLLNSGKRGKALDYISKHRHVLTTSSEGLKAVALSMAAQGNYQRAIAMLTQARSMGSSDLSIRFHLGKIYMQTGDFTSAINTFSSLIEYLLDETSYYLSLGKAYRSADKLMESVHVLENALKRDSLNIKTLLNLSHTYAMLDWDKKALQLLLKAREEAPYFEEIDLNLSVLYWKTG